MKNWIIGLLFVVTVVGLSAQDWDLTADLSLIVNQNAYSDNWSGQEKGSISWATNGNFLAEKQLTERIHNSNTLKLAFGQTYTQSINEDGDKKWGGPEKTTDEISFESMFRLTLGVFVDPFASFGWESQFMDKFEGETKYINPNIFTETIGIAKMFIKEENRELSARLGAAFKQYFDGFLDDSTNDGGLEFVSLYRTPYANDVIFYRTKLVLYKALFYSESDVEGISDDWKAVRMNWEHTFTANLTSLINVNLFFQLIYEKMEIDELQYKQTLGLGLTYKLL